jgi:CarD family transcriptional regulator
MDRVASATVVTTAMVDAAFRDAATGATPPAKDRFRKGDFVVYPSHGVGKVDQVGVVEVAGHRLNVVQISFAENAMVLRIPVVKAASAGLRKLASPELLAQAMTTLQGRPRASRLMWAKRAQEYQAKINSGEPIALAEVVRDLQAASDGSSSFSQRNLFELALERLAAEFAAANNTDKATAISRINDAMQQAKRSGAAPAGEAAAKEAD